jgi:hypothetical protein
MEMPARKPFVIESREPARAEQTDGKENDADHQREQRYQFGIVRGAGGVQGCDSAGKDRRDGGVRGDHRLASKAAKTWEPAAKA